jgi:hypothetical protein
MTAYLRVQDGVAVEAWISPEGLAPADCFIAELAETFHEAGDGKVGWAWDGETFSEPPAPVVAPPASVSSAQAKIQLRRAGLRDKVDAAIQQAGGEVQDWFTDARVWERDNPHVVDIGTSLGLKPADIDALFVEAAKIAA